VSQPRPYIAVTPHRPAEPTGAPVLLIHGFYSSGANDWPDDKWGEELVHKGRAAIVIDLPAHGSSARVGDTKSATTTRVIEAIADLVAKEGGPVDVIGYSLGARLAWSFASRHPGLVNSALLAGLSPGDPFAVIDYKAARTFADEGTPPADKMTAMIVGMAVGPDKDSHSLINLMEGLGSEPFDPGAEAPKCPVLFVAGSEDQVAGGIDALEAHATGARTERVPGDHFSALHGQEFRKAAFRFLGLN